MENFYPSVGWWKIKESIAKRYSVAELIFAYDDCLEAARLMPSEENKYRDEASIYHRELRSRSKSPLRSR